MRVLPLIGIFAATSGLVQYAFAQSSSIPTVADKATITRGASVTIKVSKFEEVRAQLMKLAEKEGGIVADAKTVVSPKGRRHGWFRLSIPAQNLNGALSGIRGVGVVAGEKVTTTNREAELSELDLRRNGLQAHTDRLKGSLNSGRKMRGSDILYLQERVFRAETDRDLLLHQRKKIENSVSNASVIVTAFEQGEDVTPPPSGIAKFGGTVSRGFKEMILGSADFLVSLFKFGIFLLIAVPIYRKLKPSWSRWFERTIVGKEVG